MWVIYIVKHISMLLMVREFRNKLRNNTTLKIKSWDMFLMQGMMLRQKYSLPRHGSKATDKILI